MNVLETPPGSKKLTEDFEEAVRREYGVQGKNALDIVRARRVKKYRDFFVVEGRNGEYVVEGDFCTCPGYLYKLSKKGGRCYHSIAVKVAVATGEYQAVDEWYSDRMLRRKYGDQ